MNKFTRPTISFCVFLVLGLIFISAFDFSAHAQTAAPKNETYKFINGRWFDGKNFKRRTFYSAGGFLTDKKPSKIDETIDLKNGFVIPPLADAHCHHFDGAYNVAQQIEMYLKDGVFYAKVQTDVRSGALGVAGKVNRPTSVDVSYSHGALTSTYGHGVEVYEGLALFRRTGGFTPEETAKVRASHLRENDAYYIIDTADDLENKWRKILDGKPDFIKIYLLESENYAEKKKNLDNIPVGSIGLDPQLVPAIVARAHAARLRVSAHVDTVTDYRIALDAGVDEMAHLPGYYFELEDKPEKYMLGELDARETARHKIWVIPAPVPFEGIDKPMLARIDAVRQHNLELLKKYRVNIAFGSDSYGSTPNRFVSYIAKLGVFSNLEMLKIWTEETPKTIFPNRRIGRLRRNYEASFLVLDGNPLKNFAEIKNIRLRFKQGFLLN